MREVELLTALAWGLGGVQVNVTRDKAVVSTLYRPLVKGRRRTIGEAAFSAARILLAIHRESSGIDCPGVLKALANYDRDTAC